MSETHPERSISSGESPSSRGVVQARCHQLGGRMNRELTHFSANFLHTFSA